MRVVRASVKGSLFVLAFMFVACQDSNNEETTRTPIPTSSTGLSLTVNVGEADSENIPLELVLSNPSDTSTTFYLSGTKESDFMGTYDLMATREGDDQVLWNWLYDKVGYDSLQRATLGPGEQMTWHADWNKRNNEGQVVEPGRYAVSATLSLANEADERFELVAEPHELEISN